MLRLLLTFLLTFFFCTLWLEASTEREGLSYLNKIRTKAGLIPFKENSYLNKAATSHAKYLIQNQTHGHYEKKGKYSYTGKTPTARVKKAGYTSMLVMENLSINTVGQKKSIDNLFAAIYHRFVFLNLDKDEIGVGRHTTNKKRKVKYAYVYNLGSSELVKLCKESYIIESGHYYMKDVCLSSKKVVPKTLLEEKEALVQSHNTAVVLYPYAGQRDVNPAFYNESPDPLPKYKVSGFPISVQFNPSVYKKVKLTSFKLYDDKGKEIEKTKILQQHNDPNHLLTKYEFALMPLARLEYAQAYKAVFEAVADGIKVKEQWTFETIRPKEKLYRVSKHTETLHVKAGTTIHLYMAPSNRRDLLMYHRITGGASAVFVDQNTLKVTLPKRKSSARVSIKFGNKKKVLFVVE